MNGHKFLNKIKCHNILTIEYILGNLYRSTPEPTSQFLNRSGRDIFVRTALKIYKDVLAQHNDFRSHQPVVASQSVDHHTAMRPWDAHTAISGIPTLNGLINYLVENAVVFGNMNILEWVTYQQKFNPKPTDSWTHEQVNPFPRLFRLKINVIPNCTHLSTLKWALTQQECYLFKHNCISDGARCMTLHITPVSRTLDLACDRGDLEMLKWASKIPSKMGGGVFPSDKGLESAEENGYTEITKWYYNLVD